MDILPDISSVPDIATSVFICSPVSGDIEALTLPDIILLVSALSATDALGTNEDGMNFCEPESYINVCPCAAPSPAKYRLPLKSLPTNAPEDVTGAPKFGSA